MIAPLIAVLSQQKRIASEQILSTGDGFRMVTRSLSAILSDAGITTFPGSDGKTLACRYFFDDWFLYEVSLGTETVTGLVKLREQEFDKEQGLEADGDVPGVTVSFVAFQEEILLRCLEDSSDGNRKALADEINRVVAWPRQRHHEVLKTYFSDPKSKAPYLIAKVYVNRIASLAGGNEIAVPVHYGKIYQQYKTSGKQARIPAFLDSNNQSAGRCICDHSRIFLQDPGNLSREETLAILATHTGNTSFHSFAAEIRWHALFLVPLARIPIPFVGSPYASAVRADLSIQDREFQGPKPYYDPNSRLIREQMQFHREEVFC